MNQPTLAINGCRSIVRQLTRLDTGLLGQRSAWQLACCSWLLEAAESWLSFTHSISGYFLGSCYDDASGRVLPRSSSAAGKAAAVRARVPPGHTGGSLPRWTGSSGKTGSSHLEDEWDAAGPGLQETVLGSGRAGLGEGRRLGGQVGSCPRAWRAC